MLVARDRKTFRDRPGGGYVAAATWLYFAFDETLYGYLLWGAPSVDDMNGLVALLEEELDRAPHKALVDVSRLEVVHAGAFDRLLAYTDRHAAELRERVIETAVVRPRGLTGAIATGFFDTVAAPPFPVSFWDACDAALAHLGGPDPAGAVRALDAAYVETTGVPALLRELRVYLGANLSTATLDAAAAALAMSTRTLQRRLGEHATAFADELQEARVRVAERLLEGTDLPLTTIAIDIGCASSQHFSQLFKKLRGTTPSDFRMARKRTR